jgi:hypothetical protein
MAVNDGEQFDLAVLQIAGEWLTWGQRTGMMELQVVHFGVPHAERANG